MKIYMDMDRMMQLEDNTVKARYLFHILAKTNDPFKQRFKRNIQPHMENRLNYIMTTKF